MNPLLAAYDQHVAQLEAQLAHKNSAFANLESSVKELVSENEQLHNTLVKQAAIIESKAASAAMTTASKITDNERARLQVTSD